MTVAASSALRALAGVLAAALLLTLSACGTPPRRPAGTESPVIITPPSQPVAAPRPSRRWGGGYYQDDGPGDNPPDLAAVPEPLPRLEPLRRAANKPYTVLGQDFEPMARLQPYAATGIGSWYGRKFDGQKTSSGERYDMYGMTAAHPILPIPSYARVTNLENGRSVVVRVNDRGPFLHGRLIDLSYTAAWKLGYADKGSARVRVEAILPGEEQPVYASAVPAIETVPPAVEPPPASAPDDDPIAAFAADEADPLEDGPAATVAAVASRNGLFLQLASFSSKANAESFREKLAAELPDKPIRVVSGAGLYRIQVGPYADARAADSAAGELSTQLHIRPFMVR